MSSTAAPSRFSPLLHRVLRALIAPWLRWRLHRIHFAGRVPESDPGRPLLICCNHVSWWDGFIVDALIDRMRPGAPRVIVMLERELSRKPMLRWVGCIGIEQGSLTSIRRTFRTVARTAELEPGLILVLFPQGRIWPSTRRPLGFESGIRLFARAIEGAALLPVAIHVQPGGRRSSASAYASILDPFPLDAVHRLRGVEEAIESELDRIHGFLETHGEDASDLWVDEFEGAKFPSESGR